MILNHIILSDIPSDYMHLICLGMARRAIRHWCTGIKRSKEHPYNLTKLTKEKINNLSKRMLCLSSYLPREFARKPRSFENLERFKATELRQAFQI